MLRTLCAEGHRGPITFLHYAPDPERAIYRDELERLAAAHPNLRLVRSYTRAPGVGEADGHFSLVPARGRRATLRARPRPSPAARPPCSDAVRETWAADGPRLEAPHRELRAAEPRAAERRRRGLDRFAASGVRGREHAAPPLLEQAEEAGLSPEFGCRMGICHTCTCRKTAGSVRNLSTGEVSSSDDEEIQICVSAPSATSSSTSDNRTTNEETR